MASDLTRFKFMQRDSTRTSKLGLFVDPVRIVSTSTLEPSGIQPIWPSMMNQKAVSDYSLYFQGVNANDLNAWIFVTFPEGFNLTWWLCEAIIRKTNQQNGISSSCNVAERVIQVRVGILEPGAYQLAILPVLNPSSAMFSGAFLLATYLNDILVDYNEDFGRVSLSKPFSICYGTHVISFLDTLYGLNVSNEGSSMANHEASFLFRFRTPKRMSMGSTIRVILPAAFAVNAPACIVTTSLINLESWSRSITGQEVDCVGIDKKSKHKHWWK
jgi:hypothetical protein